MDPYRPSWYFFLLMKCLCLLELIFTVKPQGLHVLGKIQQCIYVLCSSFFNTEMALSFNILVKYLNGIFYCKTKLRLNFCRQRKHVFAQDSFYLQGVFSFINERDAYFLDCKHKHMLQITELHLTNLVSCTVVSRTFKM